MKSSFFVLLSILLLSSCANYSKKKAVGLLKLGLRDDSLKDYHASIEDYTRVIEMNPVHSLNVIAYNNRGMAKLDMRDFKGAILDFNKTIELDSIDAIAYANRGLAEVYMNDLRSALQSYDKAIE